MIIMDKENKENPENYENREKADNSENADAVSGSQHVDDVKSEDIMAEKKKNDSRGKKSRTSAKSRAKRRMPIWATAVLGVLGTLILLVLGVLIFLLVSLKTGGDVQDKLPSEDFGIWRRENYQKSYHANAVYAPGGRYTASQAEPVIQITDASTSAPEAEAETTANVVVPLVPSNEPVRDKQRVNFLLMGHDKVALNTDVIMLVNFDMAEGSLDILQIPRDTFFKTGRINTLMANNRRLARNADSSLSSKELLEKGMAGAVSDLEKSLGVVIDGYALIDLEGFREIIDDLGGVYMDVPYAMHYEDPEQNLSIHLNKGPQTLNGAKAEMFVRYRAGYNQGDIGRVNAQKIFLSALLAKLKDMSVTQAVSLANNAVKYVTTDLGVDDIVFYAKEFLGTDMGKVSMMTLPGYHTTSSGGGSYYVMNRAATRPIIDEYFNVFDNYVINDSRFDSERDFTTKDRRFTAIYDADAESYQAVIENAEAISNGEMTVRPQ